MTKRTTGRLFVVSNRVPTKTPAAGGLAVALSSVLQEHQGLWFGWSGKHEAKSASAARFEDIQGIRVGAIDLSREDFNPYYSGYANSILWPAFHLRLDLANFDARWYEGYRRVNQIFAKVVAKHIQPGDIVWVHDYHLIPLATELRRLGVRNRIGFYLHIPFPTPDALFAVPFHERLLADLASYDVIGLQAQRDVSALRDAISHPLALTFASQDHPVLDFSRTLIEAMPIGSDPDAFAKLAVAPAAQKMANRVRKAILDRALILGVDRLDYSKGLPQRIEAYEKLLEKNAELRRAVHLMQVAPPSRDMIAEYRATTQMLDAAVGHLMGRFAEPDWQPITYVKRPYGQASLAGIYRLARVGLVTPLRDGMNLVAHEYVAAQDPDDPGVLVLSRFAGAAEIFPDALLTNPFDPDETAETLRAALQMPLGERQERWKALIAAARRHNVADWARTFLDALLAAAHGQRTASVA
jgi:trehalose 6-phosphate synthase